MTIKLLNISDWVPVNGAELLTLPAGPVAKQSRQVRIQVNAGRKTRLDLMRPGKDAFHLWTGQGLETIEFYLLGEGRVSFLSAEVPLESVDPMTGLVTYVDEDVDCAVFTVDGQMIARDFSHEEKFTTHIRPRTASEEFVRAMEIAVSSRDALINRQQGELARLKAKEATNVRPEGKPEPATGEPPAPSGGGAGAEGADTGGGSGPDTPAASDSGNAGDGPSKRAKGAGGQAVPETA